MPAAMIPFMEIPQSIATFFHSPPSHKGLLYYTGSEGEKIVLCTTYICLQHFARKPWQAKFPMIVKNREKWTSETGTYFDLVFRYWILYQSTTIRVHGRSPLRRHVDQRHPGCFRFRFRCARRQWRGNDG